MAGGRLGVSFEAPPSSFFKPLGYNDSVRFNPPGERAMIIAEFSIFPTSEGSSVSRYVKEVIKIIENSGLRSETGAMSTIIEAPDLASLLRVVSDCHQKLIEMGARRIHLDLRIDHRLDKEATIDTKLKAVGKR